nr:MAG TPA: hypothetical protein [Caudoviricetes sp.]DAZ73931.1 MAG TPA: hypothetical protein [Caudoviricetes sp.]DAZ77082.1 MAG TPA: hypothetical protein [Caudoviricetes sp.]
MSLIASGDTLPYHLFYMGYGVTMSFYRSILFFFYSVVFNRFK